MKKVVVIGSNSFSGSHLVDMLLTKTKYDVIGISRSKEKNPVFLPYKKNPENHRFTFYQMDLNKDNKKMLELFDKEKPTYIVNFAAQSEVGPSWDNPIHWFRTNCLGIINLTNELKDRKYLARYVHISSPEIYGTCEGNVVESAPFNPSTPYAASKAAGDMFIQVLIKNFDFPAIFIRSTNVYGPHQQLFKIIPRSVIFIKNGTTIQLHGGGKAVKSFIHIKDVCEGIIKAMEHGKNGEIYHLSPKFGYSIINIVQMICEKMDVEFDDVTETVAERLGQDKAYVIDSNKAKREFQWMPQIAIDTGLDEVVNWVNSNWEVIKNQPLMYQHKE